MIDTFGTAMRLMRKHEPQAQEDGFHMLAPIAGEVLPQLLEAFDAEKDHGLRCWLLELIGLAQSEAALPVLARELNNTDEAIRQWALRGLERLDTKEARTLLWETSQNRT